MVDAITDGFEQYLHPMNLTVTLENLQARVRGLIMMAESNDRRALLLTNGNQTEIALGYATLYGDMVGGLSVIGDLSKPDVYALARHVNRRWGRPMIPEEIFSIAPLRRTEGGSGGSVRLRRGGPPGQRSRGTGKQSLRTEHAVQAPGIGPDKISHPEGRDL